MPLNLAERTLELVNIPSPSREEGPLLEHVRHTVSLPLTYGTDEALLYAAARTGRPLIVLAGHLDTVPAQDNLPGRIENGCVIGLGASDMKGGLAVMVELANWAAAKDPDQLACDLGFLFFVREELPAEVRVGYQGQSKEFKDASNAIYVTFGLALVVVFLVLAAQFESWINPLIVMLTVPLAVTGGLLALLLTGQSLNIYSQIGMILLIGLMTKNGILIVEFANQLREQGLTTRDAVIEASVLRLRPILMTSIATIGGAVPLALSTGAGAEARNAIGWVIVGGVGLSTLLTTLVVPSLYLLIGGDRAWLAHGV